MAQALVARSAAGAMGLVLDPRGTMADLPWDRAPWIRRAALAGLTVLGVEGTVDEVREAWRSASAGSAVPTVRVPDDGGSLADAWARVAGEEELVSPTGELLLSGGGVGTWELPWVRVLADGPLPLASLGPVESQPEFVASDVGRGVEVAVTSEEDETWILVSHPGDLA